MLLLLLIAILTLVYLYLKRKHTYFKRLGVPQREHQEFFYGSIKKAILGQETLAKSVISFYEEMRAEGVDHGGMYILHTPLWIPMDLNLIKRILTVDFDSFSSHGFFSAPYDWINNHLFNLDGHKWRKLRAKLTPTFTSGKLKKMYDMLYALGDVIEKTVDDHCRRNQPLEMKDHTARFGTDVTAACFFGLDVNSMHHPENDFKNNGKLIFQPRPFRFLLENMVNWKILDFFGYTFSPKRMTHYFEKIALESIEYREKKGIVRGDYLDLLLELKNKRNGKKSEYNSLTQREVISNMIMMYAAGFETSSTATNFLMYELAKHPKIQEKVRQEILQVADKNPDNQIKYDDLASLKYTDMCIYETLRLHSPVTEVPRRCTKTYKIPGTNQIVEKGTLTFLPAWAIHKDPAYYPNPEEFNPENFSRENRKSRHDYTFLSFGGGSRLCIGYRFAMMHVKISLIKYLRRYKYALNAKTPTNLEYEPISLTLTPKADVLLDVTGID